jgi:hypothetical protein
MNLSENVDVLTNTKQVVTLQKYKYVRVFYLSDRDPTSNGSIVEQFALASTTSTVVASRTTHFDLAVKYA